MFPELVKVSVAVPPATRLIAPVIVPPKLSEELLATVKLAADPLSVTMPVPLTLPTCWAKPARSKVPVPVTDRAVAVGRALGTPFLSVPALTVVAPL